MSYKINVSKSIEAFNNFRLECTKMYKFCSENLDFYDKLTQDLLHKIELEKLSQNELRRTLTQLKQCRKDRRYYKDRIEELKPFIELIGSSTGAQFFRQLENALGSVRREEKWHESRTYIPKAVKEKPHEETFSS